MMTDVSYISLHASNVRNNMLGKLRMILDIDGTITNPTLGNLIRKSLECKNIFIGFLLVQVTEESLMMYQLHYLTKRLDQTLRNGKRLDEDLKNHGT